MAKRVLSMRRDGGRAGLIDRCGDAFVDLQIEIGRHELQTALGGRLDQHVGQDRNGIAPLDHRLDVAEPLEEGCAFDRRLHLMSPGASPVFVPPSTCGRGQFAVSFP
jgi:hypothetical protein